MKDIYNELLVGETVASLIEKGFLARAVPYTFNVGLTTLNIRIDLIIPPHINWIKDYARVDITLLNRREFRVDLYFP